MWFGIVSGKVRAAGFALVPAANASPLTFKKRYLTLLEAALGEERITPKSLPNLLRRFLRDNRLFSISAPHCKCHVYRLINKRHEKDKCSLY